MYTDEDIRLAVWPMAWREFCCALQVIEQINLPKQARTNSFNYSSFLPNASICTGTHSVGYSNISQQ